MLNTLKYSLVLLALFVSVLNPIVHAQTVATGEGYELVYLANKTLELTGPDGVDTIAPSGNVVVALNAFEAGTEYTSPKRSTPEKELDARLVGRGKEVSIFLAEGGAPSVEIYDPFGKVVTLELAEKVKFTIEKSDLLGGGLKIVDGAFNAVSNASLDDAKGLLNGTETSKFDFTDADALVFTIADDTTTLRLYENLNQTVNGKPAKGTYDTYKLNETDYAFEIRPSLDGRKDVLLVYVYKEGAQVCTIAVAHKYANGTNPYIYGTRTPDGTANENPSLIYMH